MPTLGKSIQSGSESAIKRSSRSLPHARHSYEGREKSAASYDRAGPRSACSLTALDNPVWKICERMTGLLRAMFDVAYQLCRREFEMAAMNC